MRDRLVKFIATGFGSGYVPKLPGTAGSLVGVGYWWLLTLVPLWGYWVAVVVGLLVAVWSSGTAAKLFGQKDPNIVVVDELAVIPIALAGVREWSWPVAVGFVAFRVFDIWKPGPIRKSQQLPGGWGIVVDDVLAAVAALAITQGVVWLSR